MDNVTRRQALKLAATTGVVTAGVGAVGAGEAVAQEKRSLPEDEGARRYPKAATIDARTRKAKLAEANVAFNTVPNGVLVASQFGPSVPGRK